jgi:hypothetical protein
METLYSLALRVVAAVGFVPPELPACVANDVLQQIVKRSGVLPLPLPQCVTRVSLQGLAAGGSAKALRGGRPAQQPVWVQLREYPNIEELCVRGCSIDTDGASGLLDALSTLRVLDLSETMVREAAFQSLAQRLPLLEEMHCEGCVKIGAGPALWNILQCPNLRVLEARRVPFANEPFLLAVREARCLGLVRLAVSQSKLLDSAVEAVADVFGASIVSLTVEKCFAITDASLAALGRTQQLQYLDMSSCCKVITFCVLCSRLCGLMNDE